MRYHAVFFDRHGQPYMTSQNSDRDAAVGMLERHIGKKKAEYVTEFRTSDSDIVVIYKEEMK